jgi:hypothetical protein
MNYADVVRLFDDHIVNGRHHIIQTRWLPDLTPDIISTRIKAGAQRTSPLSFLVLHHLHGAVHVLLPRQQHSACVESTLCWRLALHGSQARKRRAMSIGNGRPVSPGRLLRLRYLAATPTSLRRMIRSRSVRHTEGTRAACGRSSRGLIPTMSFHRRYRYQAPDSSGLGWRVVGRSFYRMVFPPGSVDLGWSSYAAQWLSHIPTYIPGHFTVIRQRG